VAESGGLENRCVREGTVGSNPTPSAVVRNTTLWLFRRYFRCPFAHAANERYSRRHGSR
jgi:hypothetical protein